MGEIAVNIENAFYHYKGNPAPALSNINLKIAKGESFGLFGPNGAGKTTLMGLMTGLLQTTKGKIIFGNEDLSPENKKAKKKFGFVPQDFSFYPELSPIENLEFFGAWSGIGKKEIKINSNEILEILGLIEVKNKRVQHFSGGMKRRVNLAIGVVHKPKIIFLDEPTVGVDVQTRHSIINYLKSLNESGTTLIYTSHHLTEAEELCRHIALIDKGEIITEGTLPDLINNYKENNLEGLFLKLTGKEYRN